MDSPNPDRTDFSELELPFEARPGDVRKESVRVQVLGRGLYRMLKSPGWIYGLAAGDCIRLSDSSPGHEVVERGGNLSVRAFVERPRFSEARDWLSSRFQSLGGWFDGGFEGGLVIFTIPLTAGFFSIERIMADWRIAFPLGRWEYGNVYGKDGQPLSWWKS